MNPSSKILAGKIIFLGSSVTYGAASQGVSFVDFLTSHDQCVVYKEAVSGTTLVDDGPDSYISRMKKLQVSKADLFVCQLSTNDATQKKRSERLRLLPTRRTLTHIPSPERSNM